MSATGFHSDTATVLEVLRGVAGVSHDPDVQLAEKLVALVDATEAEVDAALKDLLSDAHRD